MLNVCINIIHIVVYSQSTNYYTLGCWWRWRM